MTPADLTRPLIHRLLAQRDAVRVATEGLSMLAGVYLRRERPLIVNHLVTVRCNMACPFCYVSGPEQVEWNRTHYGKRGEMTTEEMRGFYAQLVAAGFKLAVIVGGEPILRTDLDDILAVAAGRIYATVFTNGLALAERHELVRRAANVFVSLDAPDAQHDTLRARPGTFARAMAGIAAMRRHHPRVALALNMTVTEHNVHRVGEMLAFAHAEGLPIAFQPPTYGGQFSLDGRPPTRDGNVPAAAALSDAFRAIRKASARQPVIGSRAFFDLVVADRPTYPCHYPSYVLGPVLPNGDVVACTTRHTIANLRDTRVADVLAGAPFRDNAAAGPSCAVGCRDWGIHDVSALHNRELGIAEVHRYVRTFLAPSRAAAYPAANRTERSASAITGAQ